MLLKLRTAERILYGILILAALSMASGYLFDIADRRIPAAVAVALALLGFAFSRLFLRCPHCGARLGSSWGESVCKHCGGSLRDEDRRDGE